MTEQSTTVTPMNLPRQSDEDLWEVEDVMAYLKVSDKTVRRLIRRSGLPYKRIGGQLRFIPEDVRQWAREQDESIPQRAAS